MPHDWVASALRLFKATSGAKTIDKVPFFALICEQALCRTAGITVKELLSSPKIYANAAITAAEFFKSDVVYVPTIYAGPGEALAFAEANDKLDSIKWFDYKQLMIKQGVVCKTKEDIDKLEIPDHSKIDFWKTSFSTVKLINEKTKFPPIMSLGIWSVVQELRGIDAYRDIRRDPEILLKLCEKIYESEMDVYHNWVEKIGKPPLVFFTGYSFNKHMMSFEDAMRFEGQFIKRFQKELKVPFVLHNCGTAPYFDEVCSEIDFAGVNGSHPLDIEYWINFKKRFPKVTIMGANIDVSREMLTGTPLDVEKKVKENIINLAPGGRYVCTPVCCLPWGVPLPNIMAVPQAIEKYGKYPIKIS